MFHCILCVRKRLHLGLYIIIVKKGENHSNKVLYDVTREPNEEAVLIGRY